MTEREKIIEKIAKDALGIPILVTRNEDRLDFHDVAVWSIRDALNMAYEAGAASVKRKVVRNASK